MDTKGENGDLTEVDVIERRECLESFWRLPKMKDVFVVQLAKVKWIKDGDSNTKLFHTCNDKRRRDNSIHGLHVGGI